MSVHEPHLDDKTTIPSLDNKKTISKTQYRPSPCLHLPQKNKAVRIVKRGESFVSNT